MNTKYYQTPIALAVAALFVSPIVLADEHDAGADVWNNKVNVDLSKKVKVEKDVKLKGTVDIDGDIYVDSSAMAVIDDKQYNQENSGTNVLLDNTATVGDSVMESAKGNIGLNVAAGDNNQQANAAALAATDAGFVFGSADSEIFAHQMAMSNGTYNYGVTNTASLSGNALQNASGNIGVNIAAGNSNQQKNDLAASVSVSRMAEASVAVKQMAGGNTTQNVPDERTQTYTSRGESSIYLSGGYGGYGYGGYSGQSDQIGDVYPDTWTGTTHPGGSQTGHIDLDSAVQGGSDLNDDGGALAFNEDGSLAFYEYGDMYLSGYASSYYTTSFTVWEPTTNTASLSGSVLQNASGNIGVNVAAGTNNQQYNGLAMAAAQAPRNGNGGGNGGE